MVEARATSQEVHDYFLRTMSSSGNQGVGDKTSIEKATEVKKLCRACVIKDYCHIWCKKAIKIWEDRTE